MKYRIRIEEIGRVPETEPIWKSEVKDYVTPPPGVTRDYSVEIYDQTVAAEHLDVRALIRMVNEPVAKPAEE